ncbi:MAG: glycosyl transferase, group 1 [Acidobacteriaceae bacterium]|nr:glycosyl transferase, group 1 [Acidobacteriaceae bacterium]
MKVAVIHDWLVTYGGADRVLEQILLCFPEAELFSLVDFLSADQRAFILNKSAHTSFFQHLPFARKHFRRYFPLMPLAIEQFDLSGYDLIISSSHSVAKGVITGPDQLHICYCHSPMRYAWDLQHQYLRESGLDQGLLGWATRFMIHKGRMWDLRTANGVDKFVANSQYIARRIWKVYRRDAAVISPPVDINFFGLGDEKEDFYLTVSRLVPYKKVNLIVEAFSAMPDKKLVVIGDGPQFESTRATAGKNVSMRGYQTSEVVRDHLQRAKAFVFAAEEDFGISVLEAQACGTPVIAFGKGGVLETIRDLGTHRPTGLFFQEQTSEAIANAVRLFENEIENFDPNLCRRNAELFSVERFRREFMEFCERALADSGAKIDSGCKNPPVKCN